MFQIIMHPQVTVKDVGDDSQDEEDEVPTNVDHQRTKHLVLNAISSRGDPCKIPGNLARIPVTTIAQSTSF